MLKAILLLFLISFHLLADEELEYLKENAFKVQNMTKESELSKEEKPAAEIPNKIKEQIIKTNEPMEFNKDIIDLEKQYFKE